MSSIKIKGTASGTATFTIEPPSTNTNRTLNLPDSAGTLLDDTSSLNANKLIGTLPVMSGSNLTGIDSGVASGTKMAFFQAAAPTGWTQDTSQNNKVLRVVSSAGGGTGGSWATSSGPGHSLSAGAHTLSTAEMPSHNHSFDASSVTFGGYGTAQTTGNGSPGTRSTNSAGGGGSHSHSLSGSITAPAYVDMIIATKD